MALFEKEYPSVLLFPARVRGQVLRSVKHNLQSDSVLYLSYNQQRSRVIKSRQKKTAENK